jgi:hypothetical protein
VAEEGSEGGCTVCASKVAAAVITAEQLCALAILTVWQGRVGASTVGLACTIIISKTVGPFSVYCKRKLCNRLVLVPKKKTDLYSCSLRKKNKKSNNFQFNQFHIKTVYL